MITDAQVASVVHAQNIARKVGSAQMAVEVYGWAIKYAVQLPSGALTELMDMLTGDER